VSDHGGIIPEVVYGLSCGICGTKLAGDLMTKEEITIQSSVEDESAKKAILDKAWTVFVRELTSSGVLRAQELTCTITISQSGGEYSGTVAVATKERATSFDIVYDGLIYDFLIQKRSEKTMYNRF